MRRPRYRSRLALAGTSAVVALGLAGWGTMQLIDVFSGNGGGKLAVASRKAGCKPSSERIMTLPKPGQITVNVYNATPRGGLAKTTADELKKRGFRIGKVGNAPAQYDKKVPGAGILLGSPAAANTTLSVLGTQLKDAEQRTDARETADVDLLIGSAFKELNVQKDAEQALATLADATAKDSCGNRLPPSEKH